MISKLLNIILSVNCMIKRAISRRLAAHSSSNNSSPPHRMAARDSNFNSNSTPADRVLTVFTSHGLRASVELQLTTRV